MDVNNYNKESVRYLPFASLISVTQKSDSISSSDAIPLSRCCCCQIEMKSLPSNSTIAAKEGMMAQRYFHFCSLLRSVVTTLDFIFKTSSSMLNYKAVYNISHLRFIFATRNLGIHAFM